MEFLKSVNESFVSRWKSLADVSILVLGSLILYGLNLMVRDEPLNAIWILWWAVSGAYFAAMIEKAYGRYVEYKEKQLKHNLENPPGYTWSIYTHDDAKIGEIAESDYLIAKHKADMCWTTKIMQVVNYVWVAFRMLVSFIQEIPSLIGFAVIAVSLTSTHEELSSITLGSAMIALSDNWMLIVKMLILVWMVAVGIYLATGRSAPGYRDIYGLRLKRLLADSVPNIANADGYRISGWKICSSSNSKEQNKEETLTEGT